MSYRDALITLTEAVDGGLGAVIMGYDGISIDEYVVDDVSYDLQLLAIEYANMLRDIKRTVDLLDNGAMQEVAIATDKVRAIVRVINSDFFIVLVIAADGNYGKGRYLLGREALRLQAELE
jgi:predicted regulator of Ras-like GTPase activity (Roadblock/LC7/MglB family)